MITELLAAITAYACSPYQAGKAPTTEELLQRAEHILVATATGAPRTGGSKKEEVVPIRIHHSFKGGASGEGLYAQTRSGTCGFPLQPGVTYLILGYKDGDVFASNAQMGTAELGDKIVLLAQLAKKSTPGPLPEADTDCRVRSGAEDRKACGDRQRERIGKMLGLDWLK